MRPGAWRAWCASASIPTRSSATRRRSTRRLLHPVSEQAQEHLGQGLQVCEQTLALDGVLEGRRIEEHPDWARLTEAERRRLAEQTQELLLWLAGIRVRRAPGDRDVLQQALA